MFGIAIPPLNPHVGQGTGDGWAFLVVAVVALVAVVAWVLTLWIKGRIPAESHAEVQAKTELLRAA
jgi:hypothetical protein